MREQTLRGIYDRHIRPDHTSPRTMEAYANALKHWERETEDQAAAHITNVDLLDFRQALTGRGLASSTVAKILRHLAAILNRAGPAGPHNPDGLGLIESTPYVKAPAVRPTTPRVFTSAELGQFFTAAEAATWPRCEVHPADWWQSLVAFVFNVGLRRGDFFALEWCHLRLQEIPPHIETVANKTGQLVCLPIHSTAVYHLQRIELPRRPMVWPWRFDQAGPDPLARFTTAFYSQWHRIRKAAGINRVLTPHDLRRTCGSGIYAQSPGAAREVLGHHSVETTQRHYANITRETSELLLGREQPPAFHPDEGPEDPDGPRIIPFPKRPA